MTALATLFQEVEDAFRPTGVTLQEKEESFLLEALVAGVKAKDINVSVENGSVYIEANSGTYRYSYLVPFPANQIDESAPLEAICEDGILKLVLPKAKQAKPMKITVKSI